MSRASSTKIWNVICLGMHTTVWNVIIDGCMVPLRIDMASVQPAVVDLCAKTGPAMAPLMHRYRPAEYIDSATFKISIG